MANINSDAYWALIEGSTDDDTITLTGKSSTIQAYRGNDLIELGSYSWTGSNLVYAGAGNDTIKINSSATVYGDAGNDYFGVYGIQGSGGNLILDGGAGADYFYLDTSSLSKYLSYTISNTTITGGAGNDTIRINPAVKNISAVITDFSAEDVFVVDTDDTAGEFLTYSTISNGVVLQDSDPNTFSVTLQGVSISDIANVKYVYDGGETTFGEIFGISGDGVSISNYTPNALLNGTDYNDTITNLTGGYNSTIYAGAGNDLIQEYSFSNNIYVGAGNDTILNVGENSTLDGGAGDDFIYVASGTAGKNTIYGGAGNDIISLGGGKGSNGYYSSDYGGDHNLIIYNSGDGNDIIYNFYNTDTLQVVGAKYTTTTSGSNLIVGVGTGSITLSGVTSANIKGTLDSGSNSLYIEGTSGADDITNTLTGATINALAGNDTVWNYAGNVSMVGGAGDDFISNWHWDNAHNVKIFGGEGADTLRNVGNNVTMDGGAGNDSIISWGGNVSINGGNDNDNININNYYGKAKNITADAGAGNDVIYSSGENVLINAGAGADWINIYNNSTGDDSVVYYADSHTINAGAGNDTIWNYAPNSKINGEDGNDYIHSNWNEKNTISGGAGNDTISLGSDSSNNLIQYNSGDGADVIYGIKAGDTLKITGAEYSTVTSGNDLFVSVGSYSMVISEGANVDFTIDGTLDNSNSKSITLTSGADNYSNSVAGVEIFALAGNDTVYNGDGASDVSIFGGDGKDSIYNYQGNYVYIDAGNDTDYIYNKSWYSTVNAGAGNDTITNYNPLANSISGGEGNDKIYIEYVLQNNTVSGGAGNDTIYGDTINSYGVLYQYASGDGNDIIYGLKSSDTLQITGGSVSSSSVNGSDVILTVGTGSITLKDAVDQSFYLNGRSTVFTAEEEIEYPAGWKFNSTLASATLANADDLDLTQDYGANIKNVNASITSGGVVIVGNDLNNSIRAGKGADLIYDGGGNDTVSLGAGADTYIYSSGNDLIQDYATVDVIQIDTENGVEVTNIETVSSNVVIETSEGNITLKSGKGKNIALVDSDGADIDINPPVDDLYIAGTSGADNISNTLAEATIDALAGNDIISNEADNVSISGGAGRDKIINDGYYTTINGGAGVDTIENYGDYNIYQYASGDGNDTIIGFTENDTLIITSGNYSYSVSGSDFVVKVGSSTIKLVDAANKIIHINDEEIPPVTSDLPEGWKYGTSSKTNPNTSIITATISSAEKEIDLNEGYGDGVEKVDAVKISDSKIVGNDSDNSIKTGAGNDELDGGAGNDTLTGGKGDDIFIYSGGDDVITDYGTGIDSIQIDTNYIEFTAYETLKSDVIYTTNEGTLTIKNAIKSGKVKDIILMDEGGEVIIYPEALPAGWKYSSSSNAEIIATIKSAADIDLTESYGAGVEIVDGSSMNGGVIFGNDLDNSIKGGAGNNTLGGGEGNDTLTGNTGADTFVYSEGDDVIMDYTAGKDSIMVDVDNISAADIQREVDGEDVIYYIDGAGELTVQNGKDKKITLMDSNGKEIILDTLPRGWKFDSTKNLLQATINTAENEIDLSESYGENVAKVDGSKITSGVIIYGNALDNSLKGGKGADEISGGAGNDTVSLGAGDDLYIYGGGDDLILDYAAGHDSIQVDINEIEIYSADTSGSNFIYYTDAGNITVKNGAGKNITLIDADGDEIIIGVKTLPEGWKYGTTSKTNTNAGIVSATVKTAENIDLSESYGDGVISVNAATVIGGIEILGNDLDNSIKGGKGGDTISGGYGNDTVSLGAGADIYIYSGGDDNIINYAAGKDSIQIDTDNIEVTGVETSGNDIIYETSEGNLKIVKGNGKDITLMDTNGDEIIFGNVTYPEGWKFDSAKGLLQATISSAVDEIDLNEKYGAGVEIVDGSKITSGVVIYGNDDNISMKCSKSADTISGGYGNDTVSLGGGADVYIYQGGNDYIHDYATIDAIQFDTNEIEIYGISTVSSNKIIETSEGNITLKGAKTKNVTLLDENEEIFYNGRVAENIWFLEDENNFVAIDIDSITEEKFNITNIETQTYKDLAQDESILAFTKEK